MLEEVVNANSDQIVKNIRQESVDVYRFITKQFETTDVSGNYLFQFVYRSFYGMDVAGLSEKFKKRYFDIMQLARFDNELDLLKILEEL